MNNQIKQQADELVGKYYEQIAWRFTTEASKFESSTHCAIIAVEEIIKVLPEPSFYSSGWPSDKKHYWHKVLEELKSRI